jgi:signal transduction histidine kinase
MLTLARGEQAERLDPKDMPLVDMTALVERASLAFEAVAFERGVSVDEDIMPGVSIHGDEQELERLTKTLIDNAVKYADENGHVLVHLGRDRNGHATLSVNNSGVPIPKEDIAHVFDRFWRSDAARSRGSEAGGYGLGLSIAKNIADNHGAKMSVTSSSEKGTTFWVEF